MFHESGLPTAEQCQEYWDTHLRGVAATTIPLPAELEALLQTVTAVIENLAQDSPTAALKAARTLELIAQQRRNGEQHLLHGLAGCPAHDHCGGALCPHRGADTSPVGRALRLRKTDRSLPV
ncbi:hypothetical protein [Streptomyces sp. NPDC048272]|uniref:hypothetical protein n=1 Tax=Streptomyces sp. NPDC048272 TaxID=3154616 RepID=UPI00343ADF5E